MTPLPQHGSQIVRISFCTVFAFSPTVTRAINSATYESAMHRHTLKMNGVKLTNVSAAVPAIELVFEHIANVTVVLPHSR